MFLESLRIVASLRKDFVLACIMPRYYCDYCDTYLTHDSPSVRKQHNAGYKHKANVRSYYQQFEEQQTQSLIDQKVKEHLGQTYQQQVGAAFHTVLQLGQYRPSVLPPPGMAVPGSTPASSGPLFQPLRLPVLPRPAGTSPGMAMQPNFRPPGAISEAQMNGLPRPPTLLPPGMQAVRLVVSNPMSSNGSVPMAPPMAVPGTYQQPSVAPGTSYGNYPYMAAPGSYPQQPPNLASSVFLATSVPPAPVPVPVPAAAPLPSPAVIAATPAPTPTPVVNSTVDSEQPLAHSSDPTAQDSHVHGQGSPSHL